MKSDAYGQAEAIGQLLTEEGETFTFNGGTFPCIAGDVDESKELGFGGFALRKGKQIVVTKASLAGVSPPAAQDSVTVSGKVYSVDSVRTSPDMGFYVLNLNDPTTGV